MNVTCNSTIEQSVADLASSFRIMQRGDECSIVTPFQYPDGSPITISLNEVSPGEYLLSDNGEAVDFAFLGGASDRSIRERLGLIEKRYLVSTKGQEISAITSENGLSAAILSLIGSIQDASYLVYRQAAQPKRRDFKAKVEQFLASSSWPFEKDVQVIAEPLPRKVNYLVHGHGASQLYLFTYEPPSGSQSDRQIDPILVTSRELVDQRLIGKHQQLAVLVATGSSDEEHDRAQAAISMMQKWNIPHLITWDEKERLGKLLAA